MSPAGRFFDLVLHLLKATWQLAIVAFVIYTVYTFWPAASNTDVSSADAKQASTAVDIRYESGITDAEKHDLEGVVSNVFKAFRPESNQYLEDVEWVSVSGKMPCGGEWPSWQCEAYGWDSYVEIKVKIKDDTRYIPSSLRANGHTEHLFAGGPRNAGIDVIKFPQLFGVEPLNRGSNTFVSYIWLGPFFIEK